MAARGPRGRMNGLRHIHTHTHSTSFTVLQKTGRQIKAGNLAGFFPPIFYLYCTADDYIEHFKHSLDLYSVNFA